MTPDFKSRVCNSIRFRILMLHVTIRNGLPLPEKSPLITRHTFLGRDKGPRSRPLDGVSGPKTENKKKRSESGDL
ncbi:hypothetical protein J6590_027134 [Homalodisca vitripennis]|nr:hypothetical protein J6590_104280 [Homalodisca vitripennis]KAG8293027.1 hypothetical protein J6590_027134 [Homalodisca vitripennis]